MKLGRCIKELERIYGVREGSANNKGTNVSEKFSFTQKDLSEELGIDVRTMQNYKKLTELIPELEDLVDTGILAPTTELASLKNSVLAL
nr:MAG TPA: Protein sopB, SopB, F plasmid, centromere.98A [Bacteriophage sp.]